jgi:hypothetical protein
MREHSHDGKGMVVLQDCTDVEKDVPGPCTETCPVPSHDAGHFVSIKVEDFADIKEEEEEEEVPVPVTCQAVKAECEVSCMSVCPPLSRFHKYSDLPVAILISTTVAVCV